MSKTKITGKVLSIQLGRDVSHFALLKKTDELVYAISVPTPAGAVEDGAILNPEAVVTMIKDVLQTQEFRGVRQAVYTLCTSQVISETVSTPDVPQSKLEKLIQANVDIYFPVDMANYRLVWQTIGPKERTDDSIKELEVQLWAVPNEILAPYYAVANGCGLSVAAVDYCGHSIASAVGASFSQSVRKTKSEGAAPKKFDWNMEISFGKKKEPKVEPQAAVSTGLKENPSTDLHLNLEKDLMIMTFVQAGQVVMQRFIRCGYDPRDQLYDLSMILEYFRTQEMGRGSFVCGVLSGTLARDKEFVYELEDMLGITLSQLDGLYDPAFAMCVGAYATTLDFGNPALNRPGANASQIAKYLQSQLWQYVLVAVGGGALIIVVMLMLSSRLVWDATINRLESDQQILAIQAQQANKYADNYNKYSSTYDKYSADWDTVFASLRTNNDNLVLVLEELESILPGTSSITNLTIAEEGIQVGFACADKAEAAYLIMALRELQYADLAAISNLGGGGGGAAEAPPTEGNYGNRRPNVVDDIISDLNNWNSGATMAEEPAEIEDPISNLIMSELSMEELEALMLNPDVDLNALRESYGTENLVLSGQLDAFMQNRDPEALFAQRKAAMINMLSGDSSQEYTHENLMLTTFIYAFAENWWAGNSDVYDVFVGDIQALTGKTYGAHEADAVREALKANPQALIDMVIQDEAHLAAAEKMMIRRRSGESPIPWNSYDNFRPEILEAWYVYNLKLELGNTLTDHFTIRSQAMRELLSGNPFAANIFMNAFWEDWPKDKESIVFDVYFNDVIDLINNSGGASVEDLADEIIEIVLKDEAHLVAAERLIACCEYYTDYYHDASSADHHYLRSWYNYYQEVRLGLRESQQYPFLDRTKLMMDLLDNGEFNTSNEATNAALNGLISQNTRELLVLLNSEEGLAQLIADYLEDGQTDYPVVDTLINNYFTYGTSGNAMVDAKINEAFENGQMDALVGQLMHKYLTEQTTGNGAIDAMIQSYLTTGESGNDKMDAVINDYLTSGQMDGLMVEMLNKYLATGTTDNTTIDNLINTYLEEGRTGNPAVDTLINSCLEKPEVQASLQGLVNKYLDEGETGNAKIDAMIESYLTTGNSGNVKLNEIIEGYLASPEMEAKLTEMLNRYLTTGTTDNDTIDGLIDSYLATGTTGNAALNDLIDKTLESDAVKATMANMVNKYLDEGETGNAKIDAMIEAYLTTGNSGNVKLNEIIEGYLAGPEMEAKLGQMLNQYLTTGTTNNTTIDGLIDSYLATGTTGNAALNDIIDKVLESDSVQASLKGMVDTYLSEGETGNAKIDAMIESFLTTGDSGNDTINAFIKDYLASGELDGTMTQMFNNYLANGTTGNDTFDGLIDTYLETGTTGNPYLDEVIANSLGSDAIKASLEGLLIKYVATQTTGNEAIDNLIDRYLQTQTTGNQVLDDLFAQYLGGGSNQEISTEMLTQYFTEGSTGNEMLDEALDSYFLTGSTNNEQLNTVINTYIASPAMEPLLTQLLTKYLQEGTTGNENVDYAIENYLLTGSTKNDNLNTAIFRCLDNEQTSAVFGQLMNKYLETGTTNNDILDRQIEKYLTEGDTGNSTLNSIIGKYLRSAEMKVKMSELFTKYVDNGTTGNATVDGLIEDYLTFGETGNAELDKVISAYLQSADMKVKMSELFTRYLDNGTTGNTFIDGKIETYLTTGDTGNTELNKVISTYLQSAEMKEKMSLLFNRYVDNNTSGNAFIDGMIEKYLTTGDTGNPELNKVISAYLQSAEMRDKMTLLFNRYVDTGTTGNTFLDDMITRYLQTGDTGNAELNKVVDAYLQTPEMQTKMGQLFSAYLEKETTGNKVIDGMITRYLQSGNSGNAKIDELIKTFLKTAEMEEKMVELMDEYLAKGTTGNMALDGVVNRYLSAGTTGNPTLDEMIIDCLDNPAMEEKLHAVMDKFMRTGTTGVAELDKLVDDYLTKGGTNVQPINKLIEEYLKSPAMKVHIDTLMDKYLTDGSSGNTRIDALIKKYLETGTTGNQTIDALIAEYLANDFSDAKLKELMDKYGKDGTSGNPLVDQMVKNFVTKGTTGNKTLDEKINAYLDGCMTQDFLSPLALKYIESQKVTTGNKLVDQVIKAYPTGNPKLDKMVDMLNMIYEQYGGKVPENGEKPVIPNPNGPDTRVTFSVVLQYKDALKEAELDREGLNKDDKVQKVEVED